MAFLPIWSCSVWGLPCRSHRCGRGGLLPHPFTLTSAPSRTKLAVCFLLHWPSRSLDAPIPDVIRHTALWSSDFPPPLDTRARAAATIRPPARSQSTKRRCPFPILASPSRKESAFAVTLASRSSSLVCPAMESPSQIFFFMLGRPRRSSRATLQLPGYQCLHRQC